MGVGCGALCLTGGVITSILGEKTEGRFARGDAEPCIFSNFAARNLRDSRLVEALNLPLCRGLRNLHPFVYNRPGLCLITDHMRIACSALERLARQGWVFRIAKGGG